MNSRKILTVLTVLMVGISTSTAVLADSYRGRGHDNDRRDNHPRYWHKGHDHDARRSTHYVYRFNGNQPAYYYETGRKNPVIFVPTNRAVVVSNAYSTPYPAVTPLFW